MHLFFFHEVREPAEKHLAIVDLAQRFLGVPERADCPFSRRRAFLDQLGEIPELLDGDARPMRAIREIHTGGVLNSPFSSLGTAGDRRAQRRS